MKAMRLTKIGKSEPFEVSEKPDAQPGPNKVAIRVHAVGLNPADARIREVFGCAGGWRSDFHGRIGKVERNRTD